MSSFLKIFPLYLIIPTVILVIVPTIIAALLRHSLYDYLTNSARKVSRLLSLGESRGRQPTIVNDLEERFCKASQDLENVNTMALIDGLYSQERLNFFGISLRCEQWDYFCQTLPNLLLGFGLLGTFCGISYNLYNLSQTLNQKSEDISNITNIVEQLQTPLQGMGVAFFSSLIAILCSSILIIINLRFNTSFAKASLISSLEDYLDNIYKVEIQGDTRLDKAVKNMVKQQNEFLNRFRENVQEALEASFGKAANKIVTSNQNFQNNVDILVSRFNDISSTMAKSTDGFQEAVFILQQEVETVNQIVPQFKESSNLLERSAEINLRASYKIEQSKFSEHLEQLTSDLVTIQKSFSQSTAFLGDQVSQLVANNREATTLAQEVYTQLQEATTKIEDSGVRFIKAAESFQENDFADKLSSATQELVTIPQQFNESTAILHQSTANIANAINSISNSTKQTNKLVEQVNNLNKSSSELLKLGKSYLELNNKKIDNIREEWEQIVNISNKKFDNIREELEQIVIKLQKNQETVSNDLQKFEGKVLTTFQEKSNKNTQDIQNITQQFTSGLSQIRMQSDSLLTSFEQQTTDNTQEVSKLVTESKQVISQLISVSSEIGKLIKSVQQHETKINSNLKEIDISLKQKSNEYINLDRSTNSKNNRQKN